MYTHTHDNICSELYNSSPGARFSKLPRFKIVLRITSEKLRKIANSQKFLGKLKKILKIKMAYLYSLSTNIKVLKHKVALDNLIDDELYDSTFSLLRGTILTNASTSESLNIFLSPA